MKMEDYEIFCRKHLSRIQEEAIKKENCFTAQHKNISLIRFHGVPVLSPLVGLLYLFFYFFFFPSFCGVLTVLLALALMSTCNDSAEGTALSEVPSA